MQGFKSTDFQHKNLV